MKRDRLERIRKSLGRQSLARKGFEGFNKGMVRKGLGRKEEP